MLPKSRSAWAKLFDVAYPVAKEKMAFLKYPLLLKFKRQHGILVENTYVTDMKWREFTVFIEETMQEAVAEGMKSTS